MRKRRRAAEAVWAVNCILAVAALAAAARLALAAAPTLPPNPAAPPMAPEPAEEPASAIWQAELFVEPPPPPPLPARPCFVFEGNLGDRVSLSADAIPLDPVRVGELLPIRWDGRAIRVGRLEGDDVVLVIEGGEEIRLRKAS